MDLDSSFHLLSFFPNREYGKVSINLILCWWKVKQDGVGFGATKRVRWLAIHMFLRGGGILFLWVEFSVLLFSHLVVSDSLRTHGLQHARLPFPSPSPRACSDPCPLSQWCHPTISSSVFPFSSCLQSFPALVFSNESAFPIRWPKYWSFSISPSNEYSGLISFRIDWFDLLTVQKTLKSLLQYHRSKASILWHSAFIMVQLSHAYMTTGKTIALTRCTFVGKVTSLLFNMLSKLAIAFLPRSSIF